MKMATNYITAEPCFLEGFLEYAKKDGFIYEPGESSLGHEDGRGCFGLSEEHHNEKTYVGCMNDPDLPDIQMVAEGSDEYEAICADEGDDETHTYSVTVNAMFSDDYEVEAADEEEAGELAFGLFMRDYPTTPDDALELQDCEQVEEVE